MSEEPLLLVQLIRRLKVKLIEILSADADFVLQHADARSLLSPHGYQLVKSCRVPSEKVTELLDQIIQRGPTAAQGLLELLKEQALQETFPLLASVQELQANSVSPEVENNVSKRRKGAPESQVPPKKMCSNGCALVKEKQLMMVAQAIGRSWREIGRLALCVPSVKLEQIEEDHSQHSERVFHMLRYWRHSQREEATAARLHSLLSQNNFDLAPENIAFLLETDEEHV
uniref:Zgc:174906 n=1 Tax=Oryzias latipes TaxID=8090 RepID=A0A3P9ILW9_ORYLA